MDDAFVIKWAQHNLRQHLTGLARRVPGVVEHDHGTYVLIDTGLSSDTLNVVYGARRYGLTSADVREVVARFAERRLPFTWWLGPSDLWAGDVLAPEGLGLVGIEAGMAGALDELPLDEGDEGGEVRRAARPEEVADHARLLAAHSSPPDEAIVTFYQRAADLVRRAGTDRHLFVLYVDGEPVSTAELCMSAHVAGLYAVTTRPNARRRGYGAAIVRGALRYARDEVHAETIVLQASAGARPFYERLGLRAIGEFHAFTPETRDPEWAG